MLLESCIHSKNVIDAPTADGESPPRLSADVRRARGIERGAACVFVRHDDTVPGRQADPAAALCWGGPVFKWPSKRDDSRVMDGWCAGVTTIYHAQSESAGPTFSWGQAVATLGRPHCHMFFSDSGTAKKLLTVGPPQCSCGLAPRMFWTRGFTLSVGDFRKQEIN